MANICEVCFTIPTSDSYFHGQLFIDIGVVSFVCKRAKERESERAKEFTLIISTSSYMNATGLCVMGQVCNRL